MQNMYVFVIVILNVFIHFSTDVDVAVAFYLPARMLRRRCTARTRTTYFVELFLFFLAALHCTYDTAHSSEVVHATVIASCFPREHTSTLFVQSVSLSLAHRATGIFCFFHQQNALCDVV